MHQQGSVFFCILELFLFVHSFVFFNWSFLFSREEGNNCSKAHNYLQDEILCTSGSENCIPFWYGKREGLLEKWGLLEIPNKILHFVFWDELQKPSGGMQRCISHRPVSILLLSHQQPKILFFYSEYFLISTIFSNLNIAFTPAAPNIVSLDIFQFLNILD